MKNKRRIFASLAAIFLVANMTTSTVMAADIETANDQPSATQSNNNQETNKETEFKQ